MKTVMKKRSMFMVSLMAVTLFFSLSAVSFAAETTRMVQQGQAGSADMVKAQAPFTGGHERPAAHTVITDEDYNDLYVDVVNYAMSVGQRTSDSLVLNCTLSKQEDPATLQRLADKIYRDNDLRRYDKVVINWHLGTSTETSPWAETTIDRGNASYKQYR